MRIRTPHRASYALSQNTVIRSGYAVFYTCQYARLRRGIHQEGYNAFAVFGSSMGGLQAAFKLSDGFPHRIIRPADLVSTFDNGECPNLSSAQCQSSSYAQQWNLTIRASIHR